MKTKGFSKKSRLLNAGEFECVFAGNKVVTACFVIYSCVNDLSLARLGIVAAKKHLRLATTRNRLKRIIRESFRKQQMLLAGLDIVVVVRGSVLKLTPTKLSIHLEQLWLDLIDYYKTA